ncbi:hypothetical protein KCU93_g2803, partial [Aureobasidium melanogenum]
MTKTFEALQHANLDASLEIYLNARKISKLESLDPVKKYLYKELTTPKPPPRDEKGLISESYEELKKRFPWPNTSPELLEAFYNDVGSKNMNGYTGSEKDASPAARLLSSFFTDNFRNTSLVSQPSADNMSILRLFRASAILRLLELTFFSQPVASRQKHTHSISKNQTSTPQIASDPRASSNAKHDAKPLKAAALKTLVRTKASKARKYGNLDAALEVYLDARRTFQSKKFLQVQQYLYKQLATPKSLVRKKGLLSGTYEGFKKCLPWPNTSSRLREAFYDDIASKILSNDRERQHAILKLYDATDQDLAPFLKYCGQLSEEDLEPTPSTRSLVIEVGDGCRNAQVVLRHMGKHDSADWLAEFAAQEWLDPDEYPCRGFQSRSCSEWMGGDDEPPYCPYAGTPDEELSDNQMGHRIAWEFENDLL